MSVLREQQLEACQERLSSRPRQGLFDVLCEDEWAALYKGSFYYQEGLRELPSQQALQDRVLGLLKEEARFLSPLEDDLVKRMLIGDGSAAITDWDEISTAEALCSRLWCTLEIREDETAVLSLQPQLKDTIRDTMLTSAYLRTRSQLFSFDATLHSLLYLSGFLHAAVPMRHFKMVLAENATLNTDRLIARYLRAGFDYIKTPQGEILLLHPGLADPEHLLHTLSRFEAPETHLTREMMLGGMNGILAEEVASCEAMRGALAGAVRPEYGEDEALEDLRMMAKQGAKLSEMREVLEGMLCVLPTPRMLDALTELHLQTVRWMGMPSAVLN